MCSAFCTFLPSSGSLLHVLPRLSSDVPSIKVGLGVSPGPPNSLGSLHPSSDHRMLSLLVKCQSLLHWTVRQGTALLCSLL